MVERTKPLQGEIVALREMGSRDEVFRHALDGLRYSRCVKPAGIDDELRFYRCLSRAEHDAIALQAAF